MAGSYPDAPSRRMAWDVDGTVGLIKLYTTGATKPSPAAGDPYWDVLGNMTAQQKIDLNDENPNTLIEHFSSSYNNLYWTLIFPELREIDGMFIQGKAAAVTESWAWSSEDTTNGVDGSDWQAIATSFLANNGDVDSFRDDITSAAVTTEKGIRGTVSYGGINQYVGIRSIHIYGTISPGETPDRIVFLDTENSDAVFTKPIDYGDVPRGQTQTRTIKLKNNSASKTINTVQITAEDIYLNAGGWYTFGDDDVSYQATFAVGNMTNGATQLLYVKQEVGGAETLGLQTGRLKVTHASVT